jgi:NADP-dependent 3-hydroxy acid dehydrogenase YdfG
MSAAPQPIAIISGAERGIGAGLAAAFHDSDLLTVQGDITDAETSLRVVERALERFGRIDSLINNVGVYIGKPSPTTRAMTLPRSPR